MSDYLGARFETCPVAALCLSVYTGSTGWLHAITLYLPRRATVACLSPLGFLIKNTKRFVRNVGSSYPIISHYYPVISYTTLFSNHARKWITFYYNSTSRCIKNILAGSPPPCHAPCASGSGTVTTTIHARTEPTRRIRQSRKCRCLHPSCESYLARLYQRGRGNSNRIKR